MSRDRREWLVILRPALPDELSPEHRGKRKLHPVLCVCDCGRELVLFRERLERTQRNRHEPPFSCGCSAEPWAMRRALLEAELEQVRQARKRSHGQALAARENLSRLTHREHARKLGLREAELMELIEHPEHMRRL